MTLVFAPVRLMRLEAPAYFLGADRAEVAWRIRGGLLVAAAGRGKGVLRMRIDRDAGPVDDGTEVLVCVVVEVEDFYPRLRGRGRLRRIGVWLYGSTQLRLHAVQAREFFRSLADKRCLCRCSRHA